MTILTNDRISTVALSSVKNLISGLVAEMSIFVKVCVLGQIDIFTRELNVLHWYVGIGKRD